MNQQMKQSVTLLVLCTVFLSAGPAAAGKGGGKGSKTPPGPEPHSAPTTADFDPDIVRTNLSVDYQGQSAVAEIEMVAPSDPAATTANFEISGLTVMSVTNTADEQLPWEETTNTLRVQFELSDNVLKILYNYSAGITQYTYSWPNDCGTVFPCNSEPSDGLLFQMSMENLPRKAIAIYPATIGELSPSYMLAWAVGTYEPEYPLGYTTDGTEIVVYIPKAKKARTYHDPTVQATASLRDHFDWLEQRMGPYSFGNKAGSVIIPSNSHYGMEHHPFSHIYLYYMDDASTHTHEAVHGWFGNGVRIECWEDIVLSEGTTNYLTARAFGEVNGCVQERALWQEYAQVSFFNQGIAWRQTSCNSTANDPLADSSPYYKGAAFYKEVESIVGWPQLEQALSFFYNQYVGTERSMRDMIDVIRDMTDITQTDLDMLVDKWLLTTGAPTYPTHNCPWRP